MTGKIEFCGQYVVGKRNRFTFGSRTKTKNVLEIIYSGPLSPAAYDGSKLFVTFVDDVTNFIQIYPIRNKSEIFKHFVEYVNLVYSKFDTSICILRCDNGGEYHS